MLRNYILTTLRTFKRNKTYALLNIFGLAVGIGCAYVILSVINFHLSFDKHQTNYENIYRIVGIDIYPDGESYSMGTQHPVAAALRNDYPDLKQVMRTHYAYGDQVNVKDVKGGIVKHSLDEGLVFVEQNYFAVFTSQWLAGNKENALTRPNTTVLSLSLIRQFFGLTPARAGEAIGRTLNLSNKIDLEVTGVIADPPDNSGFPFTMLVEYETQQHTNPYYGSGNQWNSTSSSTNTYILVDNGFNQTAFDESLDDFIDKYQGDGSSENEKFKAQAFSEIHFEEKYGAYTSAISINFLISLGVIGLFLIVTACINFINLSTAQAANRAKEIGIRKAIGGFIGQLRMQFLSEIAIITALAMLLSLAVAELMFINLEDLIGQRMTLDLIDNPSNLLILLCLFVLVSLLSGLYPSFMLSKMNTVDALKSKITAQEQTQGFSLRKVLVVLQFSISQLLIISTIVIYSQTEYFMNQDVGFTRSSILSTYLPEQDEQKIDRIRQGLLASAAVSDVSFSLSEPIGNSDSWSSFNYAPLASENSYHANFKACDDRFIDFWEIEMLAGRTIRKGDSTNIVINRKIADLIGFQDRYEEVIGETLETGWGGDKKIVGVTQNYNVATLHDEQDYAVMIYMPQAWYNISFKKAEGASMQDVIHHYESTWESVFPEYVSDYTFYDESYAGQYEFERSISTLLIVFSIISILIGCLGLYGLISFLAANKTKEIGIRKVLGASIWEILSIFTKEIIFLLGLAFLISSPLAYWALEQWLSDFPYRIDFDLSYFMISLLVTVFIAVATISHRTITSARLNPAYTLKDE
ncbi:MAG: putative ABC transport system permease protein [Paraglaciecola sp.]|jgi:putative ABC transport system permease protein